MNERPMADSQQRLILNKKINVFDRVHVQPGAELAGKLSDNLLIRDGRGLLIFCYAVLTRQPRGRAWRANLDIAHS